MLLSNTAVLRADFKICLSLPRLYSWLVGWLMSFTLTPRLKAIYRLSYLNYIYPLTYM
jgi:hypothetical protein